MGDLHEHRRSAPRERDDWRVAESPDHALRREVAILASQSLRMGSPREPPTLARLSAIRTECPSSHTHAGTYSARLGRPGDGSEASDRSGTYSTSRGRRATAARVRGPVFTSSDVER